jgi:putative ABC transport system permease protein
VPFLNKLNWLWRNLARKPRVERDLDDELQSYRQMLVDEKTRAGTDPRRAHREALIEMGGAEQIKEEVRDARLGASLESLGSELRQSLRSLRRNPSLTVLGVLMLGLGMGASTVVFSIFYEALIRPLPFRDMERLVQVWETRLDRGFNQTSFTEANFWDVRSLNRSFEELAASRHGEANLTGSGRPERITATQVSAGFFRTLGVSPILGRDFAYEEDRPGGDNRVLILGNKFWNNRFGADPEILGKTLRLNDQVYTVVGVLPPGEPWINDQTYIPLLYRSNANRGSWEYAVVGRLKRGVVPAAAREDLQRVAGLLIQTYPMEAKGLGFRIDSSSTWVASDGTRTALRVLLAAVIFLLLIGCINVANLLLARGMSRKREIAVRTALGAGRARLARFVMMESILLSGFGSALGLAIAYAGLRGIQAFEIGIPRLAQTGLNSWVLGFAVLAGVLTGVLSGLAPALEVPVSGIANALREGDRSQTGSRGQGRLRAVLVAGEVALSFVLLVGSGLLIRSFTQLMNVNRGFQTENRLVFSLSMPPSYGREGTGKQFLDRLLERLGSIPEVWAAGAVSHRPVGRGDPGMGIDASVPRVADRRNVPWAGWRVVTPGYTRAIGLPLLRGRMFDERDKPVWTEAGQPPPDRRVVISDRLAKLIFPKEDPIGQHVILWKGQSGGDAEVIGVVGDSRERGLTNDPTLTVYLPYGRIAVPSEVVVHTSGSPMALISAVRSIVAGMDPNLPITDVGTFEEVVNRSVAPQRFNTILLSVFSGLALLLATTGIYCVLSYAMSRRTAEIGLRVALGASGRTILTMAIAQGMRPAFVGIVLGALGAWWLSRYAAALLYGVKPFDLLTFGAVAAILLATALLACYLPGRRAMRIGPAVALRSE